MCYAIEIIKYIPEMDQNICTTFIRSIFWLCYCGCCFCCCCCCISIRNSQSSKSKWCLALPWQYHWILYGWCSFVRFTSHLYVYICVNIWITLPQNSNFLDIIIGAWISLFLSHETKSLVSLYSKHRIFWKYHVSCLLLWYNISNAARCR